MNPKQYFEDHLPHRVNLLTTFRDRYSGRPTARISSTRPHLPWDQPRDFFRCSKDACLLMVRFFCDEMGLHLKAGDSEPKDRGGAQNGRSWQPRISGTKRFYLADAKKDTRGRYTSLVEVLKAANRAVAHVDELDADHGFKSQADHERLFDVVDWMEELIGSNIYVAYELTLQQALQLENNRM